MMNSLRLASTSSPFSTDILSSLFNQHCGNQLVEYFYNRVHSDDPQVKRSAFLYQARQPKSRETMTSLLVDSIKSAAPSVKLPKWMRFDEVVWRVRQTKLLARQLDEGSRNMKTVRLSLQKAVDLLLPMNALGIKGLRQNRREESSRYLDSSPPKIVNQP